MEKAGLQPSEREENSDTVEKGRVISVSPTEGQKVDKGSSVTLVVSSGKPQADVPDVTGKSFDEAQSTLQAAGFKVTRTDKETDHEGPGHRALAEPQGRHAGRLRRDGRAHGGQGAQPGRRSPT